MFAISRQVIARELPEIHDPGRHDPHDWAELDAVRGFVAGLDVEVHTEHRSIWFRFPSLVAAFELLEAASDPYLRMRAAIEEREQAGWEGSRQGGRGCATTSLPAGAPLARPAAGGGVELPADDGIVTIIPA